MTKHQDIQLIKEYITACVNCTMQELPDVVAKYIADDCNFNAGYPINNLNTAKQVATEFWTPLKTAFKDLKYVETIGFDGTYVYDNKNWNTFSGRFIGTFTDPLYTIPPTRTSAHLRYGAFYRVENNKIIESYVLLDYIQLMKHAGVCPLPKTLGSDEDIPAPQTNDGIMYDCVSQDDSEASMRTIMMMASDLFVDRDNSSQTQYWAKDMVWYGPSGIGTFHGVDGFALYRNAFLNSFPDRVGGFHKARFAKGNYVASTGWPSVYASHRGDGWLGLPPTDKKITMRVMDWWRVDNSVIQENWVMIDVVYILHQLGMDIFKNIGHLYNKVPYEVPEKSETPILDYFKDDEYHKENTQRHMLKYADAYRK